MVTNAPASAAPPIPAPVMAAAPPAPVAEAPPVRAGALAEPKQNSLVALSEDQRRTPAASASGAGPKPLAAAPATPAAPVARSLSYGASNILALTASGVVVFDQAKGNQREVPVGQALPDGSVVKAVLPSKHRIETDRGPILLQ